MPKKTTKKTNTSSLSYDSLIVIPVIFLALLGLVMVASASLAVAVKDFGNPFHFFFHQLLYMFLGLIITFFCVRFSLDKWQNFAPWILVFSLVGLFLVLIPGIGKHINGAKRWIGLGFIHLQVSEFAKLAMILYLSSYLNRRQYEIIASAWGFLKPLIVLCGVVLLLLLEPDFGASTVIIIVTLGMMFLAGSPLDKFFCLVAIATSILVTLVVLAPYRIARVLNFLNPWDHAYGGGYQLTQALMAFGRGEIFGVGLGNSVQKMFYLPEAHTDFLFAVIGEELGLMGCAFVILCYVILVTRVFYLSRVALQQNMLFHSYMCYGIALWLAFQSFVNIGVNIGLLPTKGLTLPFISYGGSSLFVSSIFFALMLRASHEIRNSKDYCQSVINCYKTGRRVRRQRYAKV